jgi:adenine-specific DNA-methyltransferase
MELIKILEKELKKEPNYVADSGELKKWVVLNMALNFDEVLITLLLENVHLKEIFFMNVKGALVFNQNLFVQFLEQKNYLNESYTKYKNKVGLNIDGKYLKQRNEVALVWPFKDCILEGGQSREEDKRDEIFFNEILAQDEITQLLEPKVLTNAKRIDKDGEKPLDQFRRDKNGTITDNLLIKGNNLLVLHTLNEEFAGKIKLIYIDPPYNTGNDSFHYNDTFNHSTWLTFMKNRLTIARDLLDKRGLIFVQTDHIENHYLKILMDEIFGRDNFINQIVWKRRAGAMNQPNCYGNVVDYILMYSKTDDYQFTPQKSLDNPNTQNYIKERFIHKDLDGRLYMKSPLINPSNRPTMQYDYKGYKSPPKGWLVTQEKMKQFDEMGLLVFPDDKSQRISKKIYLDEYEGQPINCLWDDIYVINPMAKESLDFVGQKPEKLLKRIIESCAQPGDIVLDFNLGSGTTAAVAHKLGIQYIGVEQMDYIEHLAVNRLKEVIGKSEVTEGELFEVTKSDESGVSKELGFKGGGSFVYLELKKSNQIFFEQIETAKSTKELLKIWENIKTNGFLNYNVDIKKQDESLEDFKALSLAEQKQHLCEILDKNQLYVNLTSLNDGDFACTDDEKKVTKDFYQIKK